MPLGRGTSDSPPPPPTLHHPGGAAPIPTPRAGSSRTQAALQTPPRTPCPIPGTETSSNSGWSSAGREHGRNGGSTHSGSARASLRQTLVAQINSKARKRAAATRHMFRNKRSTFFSENRMGRFISLALNRSNPFKGAIGYYNDPVERTISTDPQATISMVHDRVSSTFYTTKDKAEPPHFPTAVHGDLSHLPDCIQKAWRTRAPINPLYRDVLAPVTGAELRTALHKMGRNKAPGPSGITVEMLRHLPDPVIDNWLLPLAKQCLTNQVLPDSAKHFLVCCLEKKRRDGIDHPCQKP